MKNFGRGKADLFSCLFHFVRTIQGKCTNSTNIWAVNLKKKKKIKTLTNVVDGASAELAVELFGSKSPEVMNGVGPEVEYVIPGEGVSLLNHHHFTAQ